MDLTLGDLEEVARCFIWSEFHIEIGLFISLNLCYGWTDFEWVVDLFARNFVIYWQEIPVDFDWEVEFVVHAE